MVSITRLTVFTQSGRAEGAIINLYGMLMLAYDRCAVSPLDFSTRLEPWTGVTPPPGMRCSRRAGS